MLPDISKSQVASMYEQSTEVILRDAERNDHLAIRHGYYDDAHTSEATAVRNMRRQLAEHVGVDGDDRLLDIGCGFGEDARSLAAERGAAVTGINISEPQLSVARSRTESAYLSGDVEFRHDDFHEMATVEVDSHTIVWGLEALCHSTDDRAVLEQASRVLEAGGRVAFGDLFLPPDADLPSDTLEAFVDGCLVDLTHAERLRSALRDAGFGHVDYVEITDAVVPTAKRYRRFGLLIGPYMWMKGVLPFVESDEVVRKLYHGLRHEYPSIREGNLEYALVTATYEGDS